MGENQLFGYMRLSKRDRSKVDNNGKPLSDEELLARQRRELIKFGVPEDKIYSEGILSGVAYEKPVLYSLLGLSRANGRLQQSSECKLPKGSTFIVCEMNRLSRDKFELSEILRVLEENEIGIVFLNFPMLAELSQKQDNLSWVMRNMILNILMYISDEERKTLVERTKTGIQTAKARGKVLGRPKFNTDEKVHEVFLKYQSGELYWQDAAKILGFGKTQFYKKMAEERAKLYQI